MSGSLCQGLFFFAPRHQAVPPERQAAEIETFEFGRAETCSVSKSA